MRLCAFKIDTKSCPSLTMATDIGGSKIMILRRFLDSLIWLSALTFCSFTIFGVISPPKLPFYCGDTSISKPFSGDTIGPLLLFGVIIFGPIIIFAVTESIYHSSLGDRINRRNFFKCFGTLNSDYFLGLLYVLTVIELSKTMIGELRPHFFDTCKPDWRYINCSAGPVKSYKCTGKGPDFLVKRDIFKSFPSGHAALSFYCFVFISMYSQVRIKRTNYSHLLCSWVQLLFLLWACICSLSRVTDNRHHWWDVLVGTIIGIVGGYFTVRLIVQRNFTPKNEKEIDTTVIPPVQNSYDKMTSL